MGRFNLGKVTAYELAEWLGLCFRRGPQCFSDFYSTLFFLRIPPFGRCPHGHSLSPRTEGEDDDDDDESDYHSPPSALPPPPQIPNRKESLSKDIPPELHGVSVKELVKALGESRANGNGVTPPGTPPGTPRAERGASGGASSRRASHRLIFEKTDGTISAIAYLDLQWIYMYEGDVNTKVTSSI